MSNGKYLTHGKGTNPASRDNLKLGTAARKWWVFERGAGIGWAPVFGPYFQSQAQDVMDRLKKHNHTGQSIYTVSTL